MVSVLYKRLISFPKNWGLAACVRFSSNAASSVHEEKVGENLQLRTILDPHASQTRPLVLLFGWMLAKKRHLDKYGNLYISKGFDVLSISVHPTQVLRPTSAQRVVTNVLDLVKDGSLERKPLLVHGFSVGGYVYGEMLIKLQQEADKYGTIRDRLVGQVFDSPVDFEGVPNGFANILASNKLTQAAIKSTLELYMRVFEKTITKHYLQSSGAFHENELNLPSLMLYSKTDPIGVADRIELVMSKWKSKGIPVHTKCWDNTPHVSHFHRHPDEYVEAILAFLEELGLSQSDQEIEAPAAERLP
ncbi:transmembrane protein 53-A-like [Gigantopelta aegis]|uniref:transmembrane protein 53-A-like n=1 Tax=Gigantopelta aegis TaxID=1735272 RepID=UPI001B88813A|nr:transmembrane protein 53-A-like [Gigantopelta aegis]